MPPSSKDMLRAVKGLFRRFQHVQQHLHHHQIPFWQLADVVLGSPEFYFPATLVKSQLVCLPATRWDS